MTLPAIRPATAADLPHVEQLLTASGLSLDGVPTFACRFRRRGRRGELVGVAGLEVCCDDALLRSVAVTPEWRSRGVGCALVMRAIAEAEARGFRALYLLTTTAEHYFPSFGFRTIAREEVPQTVRDTTEFTRACPNSALVMTRRLTR